jgi:hypothetical protein
MSVMGLIRVLACNSDSEWPQAGCFGTLIARRFVYNSAAGGVCVAGLVLHQDRRRSDRVVARLTELLIPGTV